MCIERFSVRVPIDAAFNSFSQPVRGFRASCCIAISVVSEVLPFEVWHRPPNFRSGPNIACSGEAANNAIKSTR